MTSPCCPPNSLPYLAPSAQTKGKLAKLPEVEYYVTGPADAKKAIVMMPDVWGWNSGRCRGIADMLGDSGYKVVVPKVLEPPFEGGTDGDGLPPTFDIENRMGDLVGWLKEHIPWTAVKPKVAAVMEHLKKTGVEKVGMVGFCWGGWAIAQTSADPTMNSLLTAGVICHPSIHLEDFVLGQPGNAVGLLSKSAMPMLFMPAGNDPPVYKTDGDYYKALVAVQPATETIDFPTVQHGFVNRAELGDMGKPEVAAEVTRAVDAMGAYFAKHL